MSVERVERPQLSAKFIPARKFLYDVRIDAFGLSCEPPSRNPDYDSVRLSLRRTLLLRQALKPAIMESPKSFPFYYL